MGISGGQPEQRPWGRTMPDVLDSKKALVARAERVREEVRTGR